MVGDLVFMLIIGLFDLVLFAVDCVVNAISTSLLSPPSSSTAVKHAPCLLTLKERGSRLQIHVEDVM